jgi:hypothetical protein
MEDSFVYVYEDNFLRYEWHFMFCSVYLVLTIMTTDLLERCCSSSKYLSTSVCFENFDIYRICGSLATFFQQFEYCLRQDENQCLRSPNYLNFHANIRPNWIYFFTGLHIVPQNIVLCPVKFTSDFRVDKIYVQFSVVICFDLAIAFVMADCYLLSIFSK